MDNKTISREERALHANQLGQKLKELTTLDYKNIAQQHTMPGTEEPVLYEFANLVLNHNKKNIVEFGCGMSTLWLTYLSSLNSCNFISFEHDEKWKDECLKLIKNRLDVKLPNIQLVLKERAEKLQFPFEKADLIFVDGLGRCGTLLWNMNIINDNTIIIADDMSVEEVGGNNDEFFDVAKQADYKNMYYFWSRDRVIGILDNYDCFNKKEQLYWKIKMEGVK